MARLPAVVEQPSGWRYVADFITADEERDLVTAFESFEFGEVRMHGVAALRTVAHFGLRYDYSSFGVTPAEPVPEPLAFLRARAATLIGADPQSLAETLVTRYPAGAGIGWHRDAPAFGPEVVGISLGSWCSMRFQRRTRDVRKTWAVDLAPRSAYVIGGAARSVWQHRIPSTKGLRYSVTFRTRRGHIKPASR